MIMDPITLLVIAAVGLLSGGAAATVYLTLPQVRDWFRDRLYLLRRSDQVAATVADLISSGNYRTVQGVFNTSSKTWTDYRVVEGSLDAELRALHSGKRVVYHAV